MIRDGFLNRSNLPSGSSYTRDLQVLVKQARHHDSEVRLEAVTAIGARKLKKASGVLRCALSDQDVLVRAQAAESLGWLQEQPASRALLKLMRRDPDELVRAYAASALGDIGDSKRKQSLVIALRTERSALVRAHIYEALIKLGQRDFLSRLYVLLSHRRYHVRCTAAHILAEVSPSGTVQRTIARLKIALRRERIPATRSSIRNSLKELANRSKSNT